MNQQINNITFQAKIKTTLKPKNQEAFEKVCKEFAKKTANSPNDTLFITETKTGANSWHITNLQRGEFFKGEEIFTKNIDEHIEEIGVKTFAQKLANAFNAMKLERVLYRRAKPLKEELDRANKLIEKYTLLEEIFKKDGNTLMATRYECMASRNAGKIKYLTVKYQKIVDEFNTKMKALTKDFPEISQVELYL